MQLRKYQTATQGAVFTAWRDKKRIVAVMPTGAGKTVTGSSIVRHAVARGHPVLWIAHRTELLTQARDTLVKMIGCSVSIIAPGFKEDPTAPIQVASIQTLMARKTNIPAMLVVVDECHHIAEAAPEWAKVLGQYENVHWLGLTATPERGDGAGLAPLWEEIVSCVSYSELITLGKILPCRVLRPVTGDTTALAANPADSYTQHAPGTQAVVYASTVKDALSYAEDFKKRGIKAACIHAETPDHERRQILDSFKSNQIQVITNVYVLTEGWDSPNAQTCIIARGLGSAGALLQIAGRVMRPNPDDPSKTGCLVIDLTGVTEIHGHPQADRVYSLDGIGIELKEKAETKKDKQRDEREKQAKKEQDVKAILERGLVEMEPLSLDAKVEWEKLQDVCKEREFSVAWAQRAFREKFGSQPPSIWINDDMRVIEYRKLQRKGDENGYKKGWAKVRYKSMFGSWPRGA